MARLKSGDPYCPIVAKSQWLLNQFLILEVSTVLVPELKISTACHYKWFPNIETMKLY